MQMADIVILDLSAPRYVINVRDRAGLGERGDVLARARLTVHLLEQIMFARFPQGMDSRDGRVWGRFLDQFATEPIEVEISVEDFDWLHRIATAEDIRLMVGLQGWRSAFVAYLDAVKLDRRVNA